MNRYPISRERGVIILALLLVVVVAGSTFALSALNSSATRVELTEQAEILREMENAKAALIGYAASIDSNFADSPGRFPCPDTDNDGRPYQGSDFPDYTSCPASAFFGRLPEYAVLNGDRRFALSDRYANTDQQFWYAVSPAYMHSSASNLIANSDITGTLTVDQNNPGNTVTDVVAVIIAPGDALEEQNRSGNPDVYTHYLEGGNGAGTAFVTSNSDDPTSFNDRIVTITRQEVLDQTVFRVASKLKERLDAYHQTNSSYPASTFTILGYTFNTQAYFSNAVNTNNSPNWIRSTSSSITGEHNWVGATTYTRSATSAATLQFANCNIIFAVNYGADLTQDRPGCADPNP